MDNIDRVPKAPKDSKNNEYYEWTRGYPELEDYDPCAALSAIVMSIEGGTSSSPYQIMLFNRGEYLGVTTKEAHAFHPTVERIDDATLSVTWHYPVNNEVNAMRSGESTATFTWVEALQKVQMAGNEPPAPY